jgi:hypothetical protein
MNRSYNILTRPIHVHSVILSTLRPVSLEKSKKTIASLVGLEPTTKYFVSLWVQVAAFQEDSYPPD